MTDRDYTTLKYYTIIATIVNLILMLLFFSLNVYGAEIDTEHAVIHHTATDDVSINIIRQYHIKQNGWKDVGYHYLIRKDGTVELGRALTERGAHAKGRNNYVGIALTGNTFFTREQIDSLIKLLIKLNIKYIERHHEQCPGSALNVEYIQTKIDELYQNN